MSAVGSAMVAAAVFGRGPLAAAMAVLFYASGVAEARTTPTVDQEVLTLAIHERLSLQFHWGEKQQAAFSTLDEAFDALKSYAEAQGWGDDFVKDFMSGTRAGFAVLDFFRDLLGTSCEDEAEGIAYAMGLNTLADHVQKMSSSCQKRYAEVVGADVLASVVTKVDELLDGTDDTVIDVCADATLEERRAAITGLSYDVGALSLAEQQLAAGILGHLIDRLDSPKIPRGELIVAMVEACGERTKLRCVAAVPALVDVAMRKGLKGRCAGVYRRVETDHLSACERDGLGRFRGSDNVLEPLQVKLLAADARQDYERCMRGGLPSITRTCKCTRMVRHRRSGAANAEVKGCRGVLALPGVGTTLKVRDGCRFVPFAGRLIEQDGAGRGTRLMCVGGRYLRVTHNQASMTTMYCDPQAAVQVMTVADCDDPKRLADVDGSRCVSRVELLQRLSVGTLADTTRTMLRRLSVGIAAVSVGETAVTSTSSVVSQYLASMAGLILAYYLYVEGVSGWLSMDVGVPLSAYAIVSFTVANADTPKGQSEKQRGHYAALAAALVCLMVAQEGLGYSKRGVAYITSVMTVVIGGLIARSEWTQTGIKTRKDCLALVFVLAAYWTTELAPLMWQVASTGESTMLGVLMPLFDTKWSFTPTDSFRRLEALAVMGSLLAGEDFCYLTYSLTYYLYAVAPGLCLVTMLRDRGTDSVLSVLVSPMLVLQQIYSFAYTGRLQGGQVVYSTWICWTVARIYGILPVAVLAGYAIVAGVEPPKATAPTVGSSVEDVLDQLVPMAWRCSWPLAARLLDCSRKVCSLAGQFNVVLCGRWTGLTALHCLDEELQVKLLDRDEVWFEDLGPLWDVDIFAAGKIVPKTIEVMGFKRLGEVKNIGKDYQDAIVAVVFKEEHGQRVPKELGVGQPSEAVGLTVGSVGAARKLVTIEDRHTQGGITYGVSNVTAGMSGSGLISIDSSGSPRLEGIVSGSTMTGSGDGHSDAMMVAMPFDEEALRAFDAWVGKMEDGNPLKRQAAFRSAPVDRGVVQAAAGAAKRLTTSAARAMRNIAERIKRDATQQAAEDGAGAEGLAEASAAPVSKTEGSE